MGYNNYSQRCGYPFRGYTLNKLRKFLEDMGLSYDEGIEFTVNFFDENQEIIATGSLEGNILKCIAVSPRHQGEGLTAKVISRLISEAYNNNQDHLFLFTKPKNFIMFGDLGFYPIIQTEDVLLMENRKNGIKNFVEGLTKPDCSGEIGAIVANCNPFTKGHQYLIETASRQCDLLHVFVLSEDKSIFPAEIRYGLVKRGVEHIKNVVVHKTSNYLISSATFPTYFIKEKEDAGNINCVLDLSIFYEYFVKHLNISKRFVGTEPSCMVTNEYNIEMKKFLTARGIDVIEIPRCTENNIVISASRVRRLMAEDKYEEIQRIVPKSTLEFLLSERGREISRELKDRNIY